VLNPASDDPVQKHSMNLNELFDLYQRLFLPIYSDYVALTGIKPEQVLIEESNILSHVMQNFNPSVTGEQSGENLLKAKNHLCRATLDLHKLLFSFLSEKLYAYVIKDERKRLCFSAPEGEVLKTYGDFLQKARDARTQEMKNIGLDLMVSISTWEEANNLGFELLKKLDELKAKRVESILFVFRTKEFMLGVAASLVAAGIIYCLAIFL
jgi:hypothetical protein